MIIILGLIFVWWIVQMSRAKSIVRQHSATLGRKTGIPAAQIEREMLAEQLTPGEWAARNGLDPLTFEPRASEPAKRPGAPGAPSEHLPGKESVTPFEERELPVPDWDLVEAYVGAGEQRVGTSACWTLGDNVSHPASLYLTDQALYVQVRPDTLAADLPILRVPHDRLERCGVVTDDAGSPRLIVVFRKGPDPTDVDGFGVDLRPVATAAAFGQQVRDTLKPYLA